MKKIQNKPLLAKIGLLMITIIWGSAFVVVKNTTSAMPPSYIIAIRFALAAFFMSIIFFKRLRKIRFAEIKGGIIIGIFNVLGFEFQTIGSKFTTAGNNAFLTAVYCVVVPFLYWIVKHKKPNIYNIFSAFICIVGVGLLSLKDGFSMNFGDILSLLCGLSFAVQIVAIDIFTENCDPILLTISQSVVTVIITLPIALVFEKFPAVVEGNTILSLLYIGIFSTMIAFMVQMICQKYVEPSKASLIMSLESVFGTLCGILFLRESLTVRTFFGCALIFGAIYLSEWKPSLKSLKKAA